MDQGKIGRFIAALRKEKGMTQAQLGERLGVSNKAVSKWENGRCLPDPALYEALCGALGVSLTELFSGEKVGNDQALERSDQVLREVMGASRQSRLLERAGTALWAAAAALLAAPTVLDLPMTPALALLAGGLALMTAGLSVKLVAWNRQTGKKVENTGMGFTSALTLLFVALKLTGRIRWPWLWVLSPLWIAAGLVAALFAAVLIAGRLKKGKW